MNYYVVVDGQSLWVGETELRWLTEALPSSRLALDVHLALDHPAHRTFNVTITNDANEREAIRAAAATIRGRHPVSPGAFVLQELERLLAP